MPRTDFRFYLGSPALNFAATLGFRRSSPLERIPDAAALGRWLAAAGLAAGAQPAAREYADAIGLREAIFGVGSAVAEGRAAPPDAVAAINAAARERPAVAQLDPTTLAVRADAPRPVRAALAALAHDAIMVFGGEHARLAVCDRAECGALMLSSSRGSRRRWCSMQTCGNRAKVAAYRARQT